VRRRSCWMVRGSSDGGSSQSDCSPWGRPGVELPFRGADLRAGEVGAGDIDVLAVIPGWGSGVGFFGRGVGVRSIPRIQMRQIEALRAREVEPAWRWLLSSKPSASRKRWGDIRASASRRACICLRSMARIGCSGGAHAVASCIPLPRGSDGRSGIAVM